MDPNLTIKQRIARLEKNSGNSSKPPSNDIVKPKPKTLKTQRRKRKRGGQTGHRKLTWPAEVPQGGLLGANMSAMVAFMKRGCHMSFSTIQQFFKEVMRLDLSRGLLSKAVQKVSQSLKPAYDSLVKQLPEQAHLGIDETGHKNNGDKHWTWCFQTPTYSLFHIDKSRGSKVLFDLLSEDFTGTLTAITTGVIASSSV